MMTFNNFHQLSSKTMAFLASTWVPCNSLSSCESSLYMVRLSQSCFSHFVDPCSSIEIRHWKDTQSILYLQREAHTNFWEKHAVLLDWQYVLINPPLRNSQTVLAYLCNIFKPDRSCNSSLPFYFLLDTSSAHRLKLSHFSTIPWISHTSTVLNLWHCFCWNLSLMSNSPIRIVFLFLSDWSIVYVFVAIFECTRQYLRVRSLSESGTLWCHYDCSNINLSLYWILPTKLESMWNIPH